VKSQEHGQQVLNWLSEQLGGSRFKHDAMANKAPPTHMCNCTVKVTQGNARLYTGNAKKFLNMLID